MANPRTVASLRETQGGDRPNRVECIKLWSGGNMTVVVVTQKSKTKISNDMSADLAAARLVDALGDIQARKFALQQQQNARRARSRRRFTFWSAVESEIKVVNLTSATRDHGARVTWHDKCITPGLSRQTFMPSVP